MVTNEVKSLYNLRRYRVTCQPLTGESDPPCFSPNMLELIDNWIAEDGNVVTIDAYDRIEKMLEDSPQIISYKDITESDDTEDDLQAVLAEDFATAQATNPLADVTEEDEEHLDDILRN